MKPITNNEEQDWSWLDVYTRMKNKKSEMEWAFRKRVARTEGATFEEMRTRIARTLGQSPAVPMSYDDFKLVRRP